MRKVLAVPVAAVVMALVTATSAGAVPDPGNSKDCGSFGSWNEAQVWFETYFPEYGDVAQLDVDNDQVACEELPGAPKPTPAPKANGGYWMAESIGTVFGFGDATALDPLIRDAAIAIDSAPDGGYVVLAASGTVHARGATHHGNVTIIGGSDRVASIAMLPDGSGYWVFTRQGRVVARGAAEHRGDMGGVALNGPIIASAATPSGKGYWMVGSDGGIFTFGDAAFAGSTGDLTLNQPVVGIAPDPDGEGYWLVAADGGIFAFNAPFRGSVPQQLKPGQSLNRPVIGAIAYGNGYLMVASDGGIFAFSNQPFFGSLGATPPPNPIVGVAARR